MHLTSNGHGHRWLASTMSWSPNCGDTNSVMDAKKFTHMWKGGRRDYKKLSGVCCCIPNVFNAVLTSTHLII